MLYFNVDIASLLWIKFNRLDKINLFLEFTEYFQGAKSIHYKTRAFLPAYPRETSQKKTFYVDLSV